MLLLVLAHRYARGAVQQDIGGHQHRVAQQPRVDVFGLFADFILERSGALQLADVGVHAQQQRQLGHLRHVALDIDRRHLGIEAGGEVLRQHVLHVAVQRFGIGMGGQRVVVGNEKETPVGVLHLDEIAQGPEVVAQVQPAFRPKLSGVIPILDYFCD